MKTEKPHHIRTRAYLYVFLALAVLTAATYGASRLHLPIGPAVFVALAIATFKASLVAAFFMHLKGERILIYGLLGLTLLFMTLLVTLPVSDTAASSSTRVVHEGAVEGGSSAH